MTRPLRQSRHGAAEHRPDDRLLARRRPPSPGRRGAAGAFEAAYGPCAEIFRSLRSFTGRVVRQLTAEGLDQFLVLGAGIPAQGNVHEAAPGARVHYVDVDPETVATGRTLAAGLGHVTYARGDATDPAVLDLAVLDLARPVGVTFLGLAAFLDDETLTRARTVLHDAVPPGIRLAFDFDSMELAAHPEALAMMGPSFHMRDPAAFGALLGPWTPTADGIVPVAHWRPAGEPERVPDAFWGGLATR